MFGDIPDINKLSAINKLYSALLSDQAYLHVHAMRQIALRAKCLRYEVGTAEAHSALYNQRTWWSFTQ
jgi:hypothetical protein